VIIEFIVGTVLTMLQSALDAVLPQSGGIAITIPSGVFLGYGWLNGFLPLDEVLACLGILFAMWGVVFGFRLAIFVYDRLPFKFS